MRKAWLLLLLLALILGCTACAGGGTPDISPAPEGEAPAEASALPEQESVTTPTPQASPTASPSPSPTPRPSASPTPTPRPTTVAVSRSTPAPTAKPTATYHQVRVSGYASKEAAETARDAIRQLPDTIRAGYSRAYVGGSGSAWYVICGTFSRESGAQKVTADLKTNGYSAAYVTVDAGGSVITATATPAPTAKPAATYHQVRVSGYASKEAAETARDAIRQLPDTIRAGYSRAYVGGSGSAWYVICGTFTQESGAQKVVSDLAGQGYTAAIVRS